MRIQKIAFKTLILSPLIVLINLFFLKLYLDELSWYAIILAGLLGMLIAGSIILQNAYFYRKYSEISDQDFLESQHQIHFTSNRAKALKIIENLLENQFNSAELTDKQDEHGYRMYRIKSGLRNSYLHIKFKDTEFEVSIKPDWFKFFPDSAKNYRILQRIKNEVQNQN
jgi:hypothetical protein